MNYKFQKILLFFLINLLALGSFFGLLNPAKAASATLSLSPSSSSVKVGSSVTVTAYINTGGDRINAAEATINYPADLLQYVSNSTGGSIFTFWTSPPSSSSTATSFGGGLATPGYEGTRGKIISLSFKAKKQGTANLSITGGKILADDGYGTNIFAGGNGTSITIGTTPPPPPAGPSSPRLSSPSHPNQSAWSKNKNVEFTWTAGRGNTGYGFTFDHSATGEPSIASPQNITKKNYDNVEDGIWYFHLKAKVDTGSVATVHYKVQIDTTPPKEFTLTVNQDGGLTNPTPTITFAASDDLSGIDRYEAKIDNGAVFVPVSGAQLPFQKPGKHTIIVYAYDKAGNMRESTATFKVQGIDPPIVSQRKTLFGLLEPVCFEGYAGKDDTLITYLDDKELERVAVANLPLKDKTLLNLTSSKELNASWQYCYKNVVLPGNHTYRFSRTNKDGAESEMTAPFKIKVEAATVKIWKFTFPMQVVLLATLALSALLFLIILFLIIRLIALAKRSKGYIALSTWLKNSARVTQKLETDVDKIIPDHSLTKEEVEAVKEKIKEDIEATEEEFDKKIEGQIEENK